MNIISMEGLCKSYGHKPLLSQTSFFLHEGDKVGIIGINGTGKSTLLRMIAGLEDTDEGSITQASHILISYLPQNPVFAAEETILQSVLAGHRDAASDHTLAPRAKAMLLKLGLPDFDAPTHQLSGGQKKKVALARCLLTQADVLILDEPTNHLDVEMNEYLEEYLKSFRGSIVMVTHDRYFLDAVANSIVELDGGKLYTYEGNYSVYLEQKALRMDMQKAADRKRHSILRGELAWIQRGARARSTKQKARIQRFEEMNSMGDYVADDRVQISSVASRLGKSLIEIDHISKSYGEQTLIRDFSYTFLRDDRIGFVGSNGSGKTTLMKLLIGRITPDSGSIHMGQTVKIGYYSQELETGREAGIAYMDPAMRVIDYIRETAEYIQTPEGTVTASQMLERFLFNGTMQYSLIGNLSGGEKRRLNLLRVLMEAPNVLLLDEPTNDLDIATLTLLEDFLDHFQGLVAVISHDRYFLDRTVRRIFAFEEEGRLVQYEGNYTDYLGKRPDPVTPGTASGKPACEKDSGKLSAKDSQAASPPVGKGSWAKPRKLKFSWQEQKDFDTIDDEIAGLEARLEELDGQMMAASSDFARLNELQAQKEAAEAALEAKMERWMYLQELAEKIADENN